MKNLTVCRRVQATREEAWSLVSDVAGYANFAPNLHQSRIISGEGSGMVRECSNSDGTWQEVCTGWSPQNYYSFRAKTEDRGYPYPLKALTGYWATVGLGPNQTLIVMCFEYEFKNRIAALMAPVMQIQFRRVCEKLLDNWTSELRARRDRASVKSLSASEVERASGNARLM